MRKRTAAIALAAAVLSPVELARADDAAKPSETKVFPWRVLRDVGCALRIPTSWKQKKTDRGVRLHFEAGGTLTVFHWDKAKSLDELAGAIKKQAAAKGWTILDSKTLRLNDQEALAMLLEVPTKDPKIMTRQILYFANTSRGLRYLQFAAQDSKFEAVKYHRIAETLRPLPSLERKSIDTLECTIELPGSVWIPGLGSDVERTFTLPSGESARVKRWKIQKRLDDVMGGMQKVAKESGWTTHELRTFKHAAGEGLVMLADTGGGEDKSKRILSVWVNTPKGHYNVFFGGTKERLDEVLCRTIAHSLRIQKKPDRPMR